MDPQKRSTFSFHMSSQNTLSNTSQQTSAGQKKCLLSALSHLTQLTDKKQSWPVCLSRGHGWIADKERRSQRAAYLHVDRVYQAVVVLYQVRFFDLHVLFLFFSVGSECLRREWRVFFLYTKRLFSHIHNSVIVLILLSLLCISFCWSDILHVCTVVCVCLHSITLQSPVGIWFGRKLFIFMVFECLVTPRWYTVAI